MAPPRDTGLVVNSAPVRTRRGLGPRLWGISALIAGVVIVAGVTVSTVAASSVRGRDQAQAASAYVPMGTTTPATDTTTVASTATSEATVPSAAATPYFASYGGVQLHLPVSPAAITVMAFHQSALKDTWPMTSLVGKANATNLVAIAVRARSRQKKKGAAVTPAIVASSAVATDFAAFQNAEGVWTGAALALYRNGRSGLPYTAVDTGARPGTPVFSPLDGTVMQVRLYKLYHRYTDYEIDIKPDAVGDVYVAMLHLDHPSVVPGDHVTGGVTQLAVVRRLVGVVPGLQLGEYTAEGGDHCHLQINRLMKTRTPWRPGQNPPGRVVSAD